MSFGLLPDETDCYVHAVYDPAEQVPLSVCGLYVLPNITLACPIILCRRCLAAARAQGAELRPACRQRPQLQRWRWGCRRFDRRIQRELNARQRRHG